MQVCSYSDNYFWVNCKTYLNDWQLLFISWTSFPNSMSYVLLDIVCSHTKLHRSSVNILACMIQTQEKGSFMYPSWAHNTKVASTLVNRKIKFCSSVHKNATIFQLLFASMHAWYNFESYAKVTYGPTSYSSDLIGAFIHCIIWTL